MQHREINVNDFERAVGTDGQLVDVREPAELATGTLPGAVNIPLGSLPVRLGELDRGRPVVLFCRSGARSGRAAAWLAQQGFTDVVNLAGGMLSYRAPLAA
jgi:rhodanese-related sulfurtransferase